MTHEQLIAAGWTCEKTGAGCVAYILPGEFINVYQWEDGAYTAEFGSYLDLRAGADNDGRGYSTAAGALAELGACMLRTVTVADHCGVSP